jgi:hypothetical protein
VPSGDQVGLKSSLVPSVSLRTSPVARSTA